MRQAMEEAGERDGAGQRIDHAGRRINSSRLLTVYTAAGGERPARSCSAGGNSSDRPARTSIRSLLLTGGWLRLATSRRLRVTGFAFLFHAPCSVRRALGPSALARTWRVFARSGSTDTPEMDGRVGEIDADASKRECSALFWCALLARSPLGLATRLHALRRCALGLRFTFEKVIRRRMWDPALERSIPAAMPLRCGCVTVAMAVRWHHYHLGLIPTTYSSPLSLSLSFSRSTPGRSLAACSSLAQVAYQGPWLSAVPP